MTLQLILATDNGFIIKRIAGVWTVVWDGTPGNPDGHDYESEIVGFTGAAFNSPNNITTIRTNDPTEALYTTDGGNTWAIGTSADPGTGMGNLAKDATANANLDEDGRQWLITNIAGHDWWIKADDIAASTYTPIFDLTALDINKGITWLSDGWIWSVTDGHAESISVATPFSGPNAPTSGYIELNSGLQLQWNDTQTTMQASFDAFFGAGEWLVQATTAVTPIRQVNAYYVGTTYGSSGVTFTQTANTLAGPTSYTTTIFPAGVWQFTAGPGVTGANAPTSGNVVINGGLTIPWNVDATALQAALDSFFGAGTWSISSITSPGIVGFHIEPVTAGPGVSLHVTSNTLAGPTTYAPNISTLGNVPRPFVLSRVATDGTGAQTWDVALPTGVVTLRNVAINSFPRTNRLVLWIWANQQEFGAFRKVMSIDVTDPDVPVFTYSAEAPFGGTTTNILADQAYEEPWDIQPLTNQIIVTNVQGSGNADPNSDLHGGIWRSTDGGATWSIVVADTPQLGNAPTTGGVGYDNEISAVAVDPTDPTHVVVASCPPYVYESFDSGATWSFDTVDMTIFDPYLTGGFDVRPQEWTGVVIGGLLPRPGVAKYIDTTQSWFSGTRP